MLRNLPFLSIGFRPFFIGAAIHSLLSIIIWGFIYFYKLDLFLLNMSPFEWHAHSMIFGYTLAVIAGFLLTAVSNWTGLEILSGKYLLLLFTIWVIARFLWYFNFYFGVIGGIFDIIFIIILLITLTLPIIKVKKYKQLVIISKLFIILIAYFIFILGYLNFLNNGMYFGIYLALILELSMILTILNRIFPGFTKSGLNLSESIYSPAWIDKASIFLSLSWLIFFLFFKELFFTSLLAFSMFIVLSIRLWYWHHRSLWKYPLLWSLYLALFFICLGFLLLSLSYFFPYVYYLGIHSMTYGGIGLITLSMMCRVSLGHTGRNVKTNYPLINLSLIIFSLGAISRVILPLVFNSYANWFLLISEFFWLISFFTFLYFYLPILIKPRLKKHL